MNDFEKYCKLLDDTGVKYETCGNRISISRDYITGCYDGDLIISFSEQGKFDEIYIGFTTI